MALSQQIKKRGRSHPQARNLEKKKNIKKLEGKRKQKEKDKRGLIPILGFVGSSPQVPFLMISTVGRMREGWK